MEKIMERAVSAWVKSGVKDFYIGCFVINKIFPYSTHFYYSQGLEKIIKAYIIASKESEYKNLTWNEAKNKINEIAKCEKHSLDKMIKKLIKNKVLEISILDEKYPPFGNGRNMVKILLNAYKECRYPMPVSSSSKYPVKKRSKVFFDPMGSSNPRDFAFKVALKTIIALENNYAISISRKKADYSTLIGDKDWKRFLKLFWKPSLSPA